MTTRTQRKHTGPAPRRRTPADAGGVVPFDDADEIEDNAGGEVEEDWGEEEPEDEYDPDLDEDEDLTDEADEDDDDEAGDWAIPTVTVPTDDMAVVVGQVRSKSGKVTKPGKKYFVQRGQTVTFMVAPNIGSMFSLAGLARTRNDGLRSLAALETLTERLADVIVAWTLVFPDPKRTPRPQPYRNPKAFLSLTADEVNWLIGKAQTIGQGQTDSGKETSGSRRSRSTTRATASHR